MEETSINDFVENSANVAWHLGLECKHIPLQFLRYTKDESIRRSEQFYKFMNKRRTVRNFSSEQIPIEIIHNLLKTAGTSPSGAHTEPWKFVLVKCDDLKNKIREIVEMEEEINYKKRMSKEWVEDIKFLRTYWIKEYITDAPYLILVFKRLYSFDVNGQKKFHYYSEQSINIAIGVLLVAIHNAGLVTLTSTPLNCGPAIKSLLGRPPEEKLVVMLPVGYPNEGCLVPDIKRKPLQELVVEL
ncbi:hypothetical protein FQA39_LY07746 [Lamprigera yunnana]|nr:hypothetical protein FQA39_LY07746 [Lamprigera yunnana]